MGMCVCQFIVAITGTASGTTELSAQRAAIAFVCIYIFFFASSWGPVAWVVTGELFPLKVRAKCLSMTTASNWLLNWVSRLTFLFSRPFSRFPRVIRKLLKPEHSICAFSNKPTRPSLTARLTWLTPRMPTCNPKSSSSGAPSAWSALHSFTS